MSDSLHSIFKSAKHFLSGTMISRLSGLLRDIAMAFAFGTHAAVAGFLVAFRLAHLLRRLFGEGALQTAFTPQFEKLKQKDPLKAAYFFRDLTLHLFVFLTLIILAGMCILGNSLVQGMFSEDNQEIVQLTVIMLPSLLFICLFGLNAALLQCERSYFAPGIAPVAFNGVWILGICLLWKTPVAHAMPILGGFLNLACLAQWMMTVPKTRAILRSYGLSSFWQDFRCGSSDLQRLFKPLLLGIIGVGATQINSALDAIFARYASPEGPAYLWYAIRIQQLPLALLGIAIAGALLPPLARTIKASDIAKGIHFLNFAMKKCLACMLPITLAIFALGEQCVILLYERGGFTQESVLYTTQCLYGYAFGLVPMALVLILAPAFYAQDNYRLPTQASLAAMGLNALLNYVAIVIFYFNAAGIAWMTSVCAWVNLFMLAQPLKKSLGSYAQGLWWPSTGKILISTLCGLMTVMGFKWGLEHPMGFLEQLVQLAELSVIYCVATLIVAWAIRAYDLLYILNDKTTHLIKDGSLF